MPQVKGLKDLKLPVGQQRRKAGMTRGLTTWVKTVISAVFFYFTPSSTRIELRNKGKFDASKQPF
jgi:hypothetical protein